MDFCSDFRFDLELGQVAEKQLADILSNEKIEVKRDMKASETGNIFIEYESRGKPSGIATTEARFYCIALNDLFIIIPTETLKDLVRPYLFTTRDVNGGDNNSSKGVIFPINKIIEL
tara:strand:- start:21532 stop:21882 length:351 start_codon:yes stop_codon:yes gene_type:complete